MEITEQEVLIHAATKDLTLWNAINNLTRFVNEFNQSSEPTRAHILAEKTESFTLLIDGLLTESAKAVFDEKISSLCQIKRPNLETVPVFGGRHA